MPGGVLQAGIVTLPSRSPHETCGRAAVHASSWAVVALVPGADRSASSWLWRWLWHVARVPNALVTNTAAQALARAQ